jgi:hypothetical protein
MLATSCPERGKGGARRRGTEEAATYKDGWAAGGVVVVAIGGKILSARGAPVTRGSPMRNAGPSETLGGYWASHTFMKVLLS